MGRYIKEQNIALEDNLLQERKADQKKDKWDGKDTLAEKGTMHDNIISDLTLDEEVNMAKEMNNLNVFMANEQNLLAGIRDKIEIHEKMFEQLKNMTGVESLEEMVSNYIAHEEEMFSLYNFIQAINSEIDTVLESTTQTEQDIASYKENQYDQDQQRRLILDELTTRLDSVVEVNKEFEDLNRVHQETVSQINKKVSTLFFKLQCDQMETKSSQATTSKRNQQWSSGGNSSGGNGKIAMLTGQGVSESNVLEFLGCIEQRSVDIISEYLQIQAKLEASGAPTFLNTTGVHNTNRSNAFLPRSPTPGPSTPMLWHNRDPLVDMNDFNDEDLLLADVINDVIPLSLPAISGGNTANNNLNNNNVINNNMQVTMNDNMDNKPIDLNAYKSKLEKKLGLQREAHSSSGMFRTNSRK
eukprot:gene15498-20915_t